MSRRRAIPTCMAPADASGDNKEDKKKESTSKKKKGLRKIIPW